MLSTLQQASLAKLTSLAKLASLPTFILPWVDLMDQAWVEPEELGSSFSLFSFWILVNQLLHEEFTSR